MNKFISLSILGIVLAPYILMYFFIQEPMSSDFTLIKTIYLFIFIVMIGFAVFIYKSGKVPKQKRHLWVALLVLGNLAVFPFFWYFYIWKTHADE